MAASAQSFIKSMLKFSVGSWASAAIAFISVPIVTRFFSPEEFGKINMFMTAVGIIVAFAGLSMEHSYLRFFKEARNEMERKNLLSQCLMIASIGFTLFCIANALFGSRLSMFLFDEYNPLVIYFALPIMVLFTVVSNYQSYHQQASNNATLYVLYSVLIVVVNKLIMVVSAINTQSYSNAISTMAIFGIVIMIAFQLGFKKKTLAIGRLHCDKKLAKPMVKYALPFIPLTSLGMLSALLLRDLLKDSGGFTIVGVFSAALTIVAILGLVSSGFQTYLTPFFFGHYKTDNDLIQKVYSGISFTMVFLALGIILFSDLLFMLLGPEYRSSQPYFAFLLMTPVLSTISQVTCLGISLNNKTYLHTFSTIISVFTTLFFAFLLIPRYGLLGAVLADMIAGLLFFSVRSYFGQREYNSSKDIHRTICAVFILGIACASNYYFSTLFRSIAVLACMLCVVILYKDIFKYSKALVQHIIRPE